MVSTSPPESGRRDLPPIPPLCRSMIPPWNILSRHLQSMTNPPLAIIPSWMNPPHRHQQKMRDHHTRIYKEYYLSCTCRNFCRPPLNISKAIIDMIQKGVRFQHPRPYQMGVIFHLAIRRVKLMCLICKTGERGSLVIMECMGPLHRLATDEANKSRRKSARLEAYYHVEEFCGRDYDKLMYHLSIVNPPHHRWIIFFLSCQYLQEKDI